MRRRLFLLLFAVVAACSSGAPTTVTSTEAPPTPTIAGFPTSWDISIDGRDLAVAVAATPAERSQGLMGLADLGGLDGMIFVWDGETQAAFWMKDTLIPLDIAFFRTGGVFVDMLRMEPCSEDPCPLYSAALPYRYAVEAPAGDLAFVGPGSRLVLEGDS